MQRWSLWNEELTYLGMVGQPVETLKNLLGTKCPLPICLHYTLTEQCHSFKHFVCTFLVPIFSYIVYTSMLNGDTFSLNSWIHISCNFLKEWILMRIVTYEWKPPKGVSVKDNRINQAGWITVFHEMESSTSILEDYTYIAKIQQLFVLLSFC